MIAIEIKEKVIMLIKELKQSSSGIPEKELISSGFLDSFDIISLVDRLEKAFGITVSGDDIVMENFEEVESIAQLVVRKKGGA